MQQQNSNISSSEVIVTSQSADGVMTSAGQILTQSDLHVPTPEFVVTSQSVDYVVTSPETQQSAVVLTSQPDAARSHVEELILQDAHNGVTLQDVTLHEANTATLTSHDNFGVQLLPVDDRCASLVLPTLCDYSRVVSL